MQKPESTSRDTMCDMPGYITQVSWNSTGKDVDDGNKMKEIEAAKKRNR